MEYLNENDKRFLLNLARETIKNRLFYNKDVVLKKVSDKLKENRGCFVTINKLRNDGGHELRGCIGYIEPIKPLYECVIENAINAAFNDLRFIPLSEEEFDKIKIEISILSLPVKLDYSDEKDLFHKVVPIKHGVILRQYDRSATFLPQVWEYFKDENGYNKRKFFEELCLKANLYKECWKKKPEIYLYEAYVFEEEE